MQATAKWLTEADVQRTRDNSVATAKAMVRSAFPAWPECRADALLDASMTMWGPRSADYSKHTCQNG